MASTVASAAALETPTLEPSAQHRAAIEAAVDQRSAGSTFVVPMTYHAPASPNRPGIVIEGDCGAAFLHVARVNQDETRATYGFDRLATKAIGFHARAVFVNEDTDRVETDEKQGSLRARSAYERSVTKPTGSGTVTVYAYLRTVNVDGSYCESDDDLRESMFVY